MASKKADNGVSVTSAPTTIYDPASSGPCSAFLITNRSSSVDVLLVNVAGLHESTEFIGIPAGLSVTFAYRTGGLSLGKVIVKSTGGATIDFGVVSVGQGTVSIEPTAFDVAQYGDRFARYGTQDVNRVITLETARY